MAKNDKTPAPQFATREEWLLAAIDAMRSLFDEILAPLPSKIHISVGFGYQGKAENKSLLAQTWAKCTSSDGAPSVFISPVLETAEDALAALSHELVHVADDVVHGHGRVFADLGKALGLEGKPSFMLPGPALSATLCLIALALGAYPHAKLDTDVDEKPATDADGVEIVSDGETIVTTRRVRTGPRTQTNRHVLAVCTNSQCSTAARGGYAVRTTRTWLAVAVPNCPVCGIEMSV